MTYMSKDDPPVLFHGNYGPPRRPGEEERVNVHSHLFAQHGYERYRAVGGTCEIIIGDVQSRGAVDEAEIAFLRKYLLGNDAMTSPDTGGTSHEP